MKCPDCDGQGWTWIVPDHSGLLCKTCHGIGEIPDKEKK
ncbi:hypothetical protein LCGC14_1615720 [marine sediment metagenome]|uniref:Uncharacterized protein n=1 Tax=marine sediment metagenome TaxID=412755 RepID=A0A0F9ITS7_9ZZZZ